MVVAQQEIQPETETTTSSAGIWDKVAVYGIAVLFVGMPLVFGWLYTYDMFDLPKLVFLRVMSLVILGAWLIKVVYSGEFQWRRTPLDIPVLAFGLASLLSTIHTLSPNLSLHGEYRRYEGLYTIINYLVLYFFVTNLFHWANERRSSVIGDLPLTLQKVSTKSAFDIFRAFVHRLERTIGVDGGTWSLFDLLLSLQVVAGVLVALYGILQHFGQDFVLYDPHGIAQVVSTYGNTNFLAAYLVMVIPIAISLFFATDSIAKKLFTSSCILVMMLCLFYTSSRAAWLGLAVAVAFLLYLTGKQVLRRNGLWLALVALLLMVPPLANYNFVLGRLEAIFSPGQTTVAYRLQWWQSLLLVARDNPILGTGISTLEVAYPKYATLEYAMTEGKDTFLDKAHNELIQLAVTQGLVGLGTYLFVLAAFGVFVFGCWRRKRRSQSFSGNVESSLDLDTSAGIQPAAHFEERWLLLSGLTAGIIAYLVQNEFSFGVIGISSLFWMMMGFVVILGTPEEEFRTIRWQFRLPQNWPFGLSLLITVILAVLSTIAWRPFTADQLYKQAMTQFSDGQLDQAEATYKSVLALNPYQTEYWRGLATTYVQKAQVTAMVSGTTGEAARVQWLDQAVETFNKAADLNPAPFHFFFLGETQEAYGTNKGLQEAYQSYKKAVSLYPYYLYANKSLGEVAYRLKIFDESARAFQMAALLDPQDVTTQSSLALDYFNLGKDDEQYSAWQRVVQLDPNNYPAYYYLGLLDEKRGKTSNAIQNYETFLTIVPKPQDQQDYDSLKQQVENSLKKLGK